METKELAYLLSSAGVTGRPRLLISLSLWLIIDPFQNALVNQSNAKLMLATWTTLNRMLVVVWGPPFKMWKEAHPLCICPSLTSAHSSHTSFCASWKCWRRTPWWRPPRRTSHASSGPVKRGSNRAKSKLTNSPSIIYRSSDSPCHCKRCKARPGRCYRLPKRTLNKKMPRTWDHVLILPIQSSTEVGSLHLWDN